jgi:CRISPR/Cas system-associated exonuclease Cas4 (RecB family)
VVFLISHIEVSKIEHMSDQWIRASELSDYLYCRRSWWLKRVRGHASKNVRELQSGTRYHEKHGRFLQRSIWAKRLAYALLFCMVAFITFQILMNS